MAIFTILSSSKIQAQHPGFFRYTVNDQLASNFIYDIHQDQKGFIWIGTDYGLSRFDGYAFESYTCVDGLSDKEILKIEEDQEGRLWLLTSNGFPSYYQNDQFFNAANDSALVGVDLDSYIKFICEPGDGSVELMGLSPTHFKIRAGQQSEKIMLPIIRGATYLGKWKGPKGQEWLFNTKCINDLANKDSLLIPYERSLYSRLYTSASDSLVYLTFKEGLVRFDGQDLQLIRGTQALGEDEILFWGMGQGKDCWIGTMKGAYHGQIRGDSLHILHHLFPESAITSILRDREGAYWFGTIQEGLLYVPSLKVERVWNPGQSSHTAVYSLYHQASQDRLLAGLNNNQFLEIKAGQLERKTLPLEKRGLHRTKRIQGLTEQQVLFIADGGIVIEDSTSEIIISEIYSHTVAVLADQKMLTKGSYTSICLPPELWKESLHFNESLMVQHEFKADSILIYEEETNGFCQAISLYQEGHSLLEAIDLPSDWHRHWEEVVRGKDGTLWVATKGWGVYGIFPDTLIHLNEDVGLSSNSCKRLELRDSLLWIATNAGVNRVRLFPDYSFHISVLDQQDGLSSNNINDLEIVGPHLWIATDQGLSRLNWEGEWQENTSIPLFFTQIEIENQPRDWSDNLRVKYWENDVHVDFVGLAFRYHKQLRYHYRLRGQNEAWRTTKENSLHFNDLAPGTYELEIKASVDMNTPGEELLQLNFCIAPPFWRTWWFRGILLLLVGSFIFLIFRVQVLTYDQEALHDLISEMKTRLVKKEPKHLFFKVNGQQTKVQLEQIYWINGAGDYIEIITKDGKHLVKESLRNVIQKLDEQEFTRVHRSYIVRNDQIERFSASKSLTIQGQEIPVGRKYAADFSSLKSRLVQNLSEKGTLPQLQSEKTSI